MRHLSSQTFVEMTLYNAGQSVPTGTSLHCGGTVIWYNPFGNQFSNNHQEHPPPKKKKKDCAL